MRTSYVPIITVLLLVSLKAQATRFDASGYLRAGTGWNGSERRMICVGNSGASTNEFRLGNECSFYGELGLTAHHETEAAEAGDFFDSHVRFSMFPEGRRLYDSADINGRGVNLTEAFAEARYRDLGPLTFWVGKRFYRENDISICDWYSFADTSGVGAGIQGVPMPVGELAMAHLIQGSESTPSTGVPVIQFLDFRWRGISLTEKGQLLLWSGYAWSSRGDDGAGTRYVPGHGAVLGAQWKQELSFGRNELALIYGHGLMQGMNLYGPNPMTSPDANEAKRLRLTESFEFSAGDTWTFLGVLATDEVDSGAAQRSRSTWRSVGLRSFYQAHPHWRMLMEVGHSRYQAQSEVDAQGAELGERTMNRVTIGPELSINRSIWGRPVLRAFATYSSWNDANIAKMGSTTTALRGQSETWNFGYQTEIWF